MTYSEAIQHFKTQSALAAALGITQPTVSAWNKVIPPRYQFQIEVITDRALTADRSLIPPKEVA